MGWTQSVMKTGNILSAQEMARSLCSGASSNFRHIKWVKCLEWRSLFTFIVILSLQEYCVHLLNASNTPLYYSMNTSCTCILWFLLSLAGRFSRRRCDIHSAPWWCSPVLCGHRDNTDLLFQLHWLQRGVYHLITTSHNSAVNNVSDTTG
jgi:hypothetical protein